MTSDRTESKVRQWAMKRNGDPLEPHDVIELVLAVDDDAVQRHEDNVGVMKGMEARLAALEGWQRGSNEVLRQLIEEDHAARHAAHLATDHVAVAGGPAADGSDDEARKVWVMWGVGQKLVVIVTSVVVAGLTMFISWLLYGHP